MRTKALARALRAFAELGDFGRSQELHGFASFVEQGSSETVFSRLKRLSKSRSYPLRLKESLEAIQAGLKSVGAVKQANAIDVLQNLFEGRPGATLEKFLEEVSMPPEAPDLGAPRFKSANFDLAKNISGRLAEPSLDPRSFEAIMEKLSSPKVVDTATLALIANLSLSNRRVYRDRKLALTAIYRHFRNRSLRATAPCDEPD